MICITSLSTIWPVKGLLQNNQNSRSSLGSKVGSKDFLQTWRALNHYYLTFFYTSVLFCSSIVFAKQKACHFANYAFNRASGRCYLEILNSELPISTQNIFTRLWTVKDQKVLPTLCGYFKATAMHSERGNFHFGSHFSYTHHYNPQFVCFLSHFSGRPSWNI